MIWAIVALFGALGTLLRFAVDTWVLQSSWPPYWGTLFINSLGSLAAGIFYGLSVEKGIIPPTLKLGLLVGLCGGFTTFSGFALQLLQQASEGHLKMFLLLIVSSPILCGLTAWTGLFLSRLV